MASTCRTVGYVNYEFGRDVFMWLSIQIARDEFHWTNGGGSRERGGAGGSDVTDFFPPIKWRLFLTLGSFDTS